MSLSIYIYVYVYTVYIYNKLTNMGHSVMYRFNVDNMILAGIWCGRSKPIIKVFVKQFVNEIQTLASEGMNYVYPLHGFCRPVCLSVCRSVKDHIFHSNEVFIDEPLKDAKLVSQELVILP